MKHIFTVEDVSDDEVLVTHKLEGENKTSPESLCATTNDEDDGWVVEYGEDDEDIASYDTKAEAVAGIVNYIIDFEENDELNDALKDDD